MQLLAGSAIIVALYLSTPSSYLTSTEEQSLMVWNLTEELSKLSEEEGARRIDEFIEETGINIAIYDGTRSTSDKKVFAETHSQRSLKTEEEVQACIEKSKVEDSDEALSLWYLNQNSYWTADGKTCYEIEYFFNTEKENVLPRSIHKSMPIMVVVITGISLLCAIIYTRLFAKPVKELSAVSKSMAEMNFDRKCDTKRKDEIGDLGRDLDTMAVSLQEKMSALHARTAELEEEVARRQELESQKDMFFAAASHELKTPVTLLEGQVRGMIEGVEPYTDHDLYLSRALGTIKRMESLINEILTASRMQSEQEIVSTKSDLSQILKEKTAECEDLFEVRGMMLKSDIQQELFFNGNRELTAMAVGTFLSDGAFYSQDGAEVILEGKCVDQKIRVTIRNTRARIEEEDLANLFEPFYRSDKSRNRRSGGSGLGLYLARLIIEKQGGTCTLENVGEDVLATIELPVFHSTENP